MLEESLEGRRLPLELERPFKRLKRNFEKIFTKIIGMVQIRIH